LCARGRGGHSSFLAVFQKADERQKRYMYAVALYIFPLVDASSKTWANRDKTSRIQQMEARDIWYCRDAVSVASKKGECDVDARRG
jgi:hypothetical protein